MARDLRARGRLALTWRRRQNAGMRVIAHRGFRGYYPENTMSAFAASLGCSHMVELDVRLSLDDQVVVFHDDTLERCSNATTLGPQLGLESSRVDQWRLDQLHLLDLGDWFYSRQRSADQDLIPVTTESLSLPYRPTTRELLPTLAATLAWAKAYQMPLNVELKDQGSENRNDRLVRQVVRRIVAADCTELVLLSSFNYAMLLQCRGLAPFISRAVLYGDKGPPDLLDLLAAVDACACHPEHSGLDAELVRHLQLNGYAVHAWTVNERERWQYLQQCGVNGLITDFPCLKRIGKEKMLVHR
ncbi:MAG: hypothetical protein GX087_11035 [Desulfobulbaceae bacterium]|nr:hypothetical protein [Desulfobulbaceae bacterium]